MQAVPKPETRSRRDVFGISGISKSGIQTDRSDPSLIAGPAATKRLFRGRLPQPVQHRIRDAPDANPVSSRALTPSRPALLTSVDA